MSKEKDKSIKELFNTYEATTISHIPIDVAMLQMTLLDVLEEDEIIADWRLITEDGSNIIEDDELVSLVVFGWGEPQEIEND